VERERPALVTRAPKTGGATWRIRIALTPWPFSTVFYSFFFPLLPLLPLMCFENAYPNPARCTVTAGQWQRAKQKPNSSSVSPRSWSERVAGREPFRWGWQHQHGRAPTQLQRDSGR